MKMIKEKIKPNKINARKEDWGGFAKMKKMKIKMIKINIKPNMINARKDNRRGFAQMHQFSKR